MKTGNQTKNKKLYILNKKKETKQKLVRQT